MQFPDQGAMGDLALEEVPLQVDEGRRWLRPLAGQVALVRSSRA